MNKEIPMINAERRMANYYNSTADQLFVMGIFTAGQAVGLFGLAEGLLKSNNDLTTLAVILVGAAQAIYIYYGSKDTPATEIKKLITNSQAHATEDLPKPDTDSLTRRGKLVYNNFSRLKRFIG